MLDAKVVVGKYQCGACGRILKATQEMLGRRARCRCGNEFRIDDAVILVDSETEAETPSDSTPATQSPSSHRAVQSAATDDDVQRVRQVRDAFAQMKEQLGQVIIGQGSVIEQTLIAMFCRGHVLLTGVPGLAKTLLVSSLSQVLDLRYRRIQFTPDLMPADITGTEVLQEDRTSGRRNFQFVEGPIFANLVLADEINRSPPRTQSAMLEAMQERQVTTGDLTRTLPSPFFVMATRNPIEQEGTYPLPEAQLDRFLFNIVVDYPDREQEFAVIRQATSDWQTELKPVLDAPMILAIQQTVRRIPAADHVIAYARDLVQATRPGQPDAPDFVKELVGWGAGPRAGISLVMAAKARAILHGRFHATTEDIRQVALPVLRHRVVTTFNADASGIRRDDVIRMLLDQIKPQAPQGASDSGSPSNRGLLSRLRRKS